MVSLQNVCFLLSVAVFLTDELMEFYVGVFLPQTLFLWFLAALIMCSEEKLDLRHYKIPNNADWLNEQGRDHLSVCVCFHTYESLVNWNLHAGQRPKVQHHLLLHWNNSLILGALSRVRSGGEAHIPVKQTWLRNSRQSPLLKTTKGNCFWISLGLFGGN